MKDFCVVQSSEERHHFMTMTDDSTSNVSVNDTRDELTFPGEKTGRQGGSVKVSIAHPDWHEDIWRLLQPRYIK
jgi:hypothetical protein